MHDFVYDWNSVNTREFFIDLKNKRRHDALCVSFVVYPETDIPIASAFTGTGRTHSFMIREFARGKAAPGGFRVSSRRSVNKNEMGSNFHVLRLFWRSAAKYPLSDFVEAMRRTSK
jgi:hypothetical protein